MRRSKTLLGVAVTATAIMGLGTAPAVADTTCHQGEHSPGMGWYRFCKIDTAVPGAHLTGVVNWEYNTPGSRNPKAQTGTAQLTVEDTRADGSCGWIRGRYYGGSAASTDNYWSACGKGEEKRVSLELNQQTVGQYTDGYFAFYVCSPQDTCTRVWRQNVAAKGPS